MNEISVEKLTFWVSSKRQILFILLFTFLLTISKSENVYNDDEMNIIKTILTSPLRQHVISSRISNEPLEEIETNEIENNTNIETNSSAEELDTPETENNTNIENLMQTVKQLWNQNNMADDTETEIIEEEDDDNVYRVIKNSFTNVVSLVHFCNDKINDRLKRLNVENDDPLMEFKTYAYNMQQCIKVKTFKQVDGILSNDTIPITEDIAFKMDESRARSESSKVYYIPSFLNGKLGFWKNSNSTDVRDGFRKYVEHILNHDWTDLLLERIGYLFETHTLRFNFDNTGVEGRGRRRNQMFQMMVMGFMIMATILIPMGFQFLTVLGGKSLLMAKMALIMSAINGLKKIATSHVDYGLYHTPDHHHDFHHHGFHDRVMQDKVFQIKTDEPIL